MKQYETISNIMPTVTTQITSRSYITPTKSSTNCVSEKSKALIRRFGRSDEFLRKVTPDTQLAFAQNTQAAFMGNYPTLTDLKLCYGNTFPEQWLVPLIADATLFVGAKNLDKRQQLQLAQIIAVEYHYLKVTEFLVFFHRFKTGHYGRFYGSVDPLVITCAIRDFIRERNDIIAAYEQQEREKREAEQAENAMTREEWQELKTIIAMYNSEYCTSE